MANITDYLAGLADGMIERNPEPSDHRYEMFDTGGVELEVGELLYGLVRAIKPKRVLTTGIYTGVSDMYIAQALKDNCIGYSEAVEFEIQHIRRAVQLWERVGVKDYIHVTCCSSLDYEASGEYEFMFLDTEPNIRFYELEKFYQFMAPGCIVGLHDLPRTFCQGNTVKDANGKTFYDWPWGQVPNFMHQLLIDGSLRKFHIPTPRGLTFFYKKHMEDYLP